MDRREPTSSKGKTVAMIAIVFIGLGAYMASGIFYHVKESMTNEEPVRIAEGVDPDSIEPEVIYGTKEEIEEKLYGEIEAGADGGIYMKVSDIFSEDDIQEIGRSIDPFYGRVDQYTFSTSTTRDGDGPEIKDPGMSVSFSFVRSNEAYVYDSIVNGVEIPAEKTEAIELKKVCEDFEKEYITDGMSDYDIELAVHDYIVDNCDYSKNINENDYTSSSYGVLVKHDAVCEGYARATALLLRLEGIETELVTGTAKSSGDDLFGTEPGSDGHMWNQVYINNSWYNLDTTWDDPVGDNSTPTHLYFNVSDKILSKNHGWDKEKYKKCTSSGMNYYHKNGIYFDNEESFHEFVNSEIGKGKDEIECAISNLDTGEEAMYFIFDNEGINSYSILSSGEDEYRVVEISLQ